MPRVLTVVVLLLVTVPQACRRDDATAPPPIGPSLQSSAASAPVIAFASNRDGNYEIYVMNADGSAQTRLTSNTGTDVEPSWSYDGRQIAFVGPGAFGVITVMQADGSGLTALRGGTDPTWSPDGRIAFTSNQTGTYQIYVMQADGSAVTRLTNNTNFDVSPSWSPDGRQIAFQSDRDGNLEIYVMNSDGTAQTRLTNNAIGDGVDGDPSWSPDSRRIAFTSTRDGDSEVYVMNADGSGQTRLTNSAGFDGDPTWSASGLRIAFTSGRNGSNEIYVMNSDGSAPTRLTSNAADERGASWSPAGQVTSGTLAFVVQPPASVHVGATMSPPVQVAVQDTLGNAVPGATNAVTLSLASNPSGATLLGTTTVEAVDGIATFADLRLDRAGTGYTLVARAAGLTDGTSAAFEVVPSNLLAFVVQPPADVDAGAVMAPSVQIAVQDTLGNTVPGATDAVTLVLAENASGAELLGTTTLNAVDGVATFADLRVDRPGRYTLVAAAAGFADVASTPFAVHVTFVQVTAGYRHTCGLATSGTTYCWGDDASGQLGDGTTTSRPTPVPVAGGLRFTAISAGGGLPFLVPGHTCGVTAAGAAYCWGDNSYGQLGDSTLTGRASPVAVAGGLTFAMLGAGVAHTCGVTASGEAYCWGANFKGGLGDGTMIIGRQSPGHVVGAFTFATVDPGSAHTCGVMTNGVPSCWGANFLGQLGDGTTADRAVPGPVLAVPAFALLNAGTNHTCGVTTSATAYCWGENSAGQLGDGTFDNQQTPRPTPTQVVGGLSWQAVSAAYRHTCGVTTTGAAYCWGIGGALGDGTPISHSSPTAVSGDLRFTQLSAGFDHTCGVTTSGAVYCWGNNATGKLGDGTLTSRLRPTPVVQ